MESNFTLNTPMVIPAKYQTKLLEKNNLSSHFIHLVMPKPEGFSYLAGQYISLVVGTNVRRAYSVCNWPAQNAPHIEAGKPARPNAQSAFGGGDMLELLVDTKAGGPGSKFVEKLQVGEEMEFWGPYGKFVIPENIAGNVWLMGTGSGVAPLKAQVERISLPAQMHKVLLAGEINKIRLIYGTRKEEDIVFLKNFENLAKTSKYFYYHVALSQPTAGFNPEWGEYWHKGYVTEIAQELLRKEKPDFVFLCGHPDMMKDAIALFLQADVPEKNILFEKFS